MSIKTLFSIKITSREAAQIISSLDTFTSVSETLDSEAVDESMKANKALDSIFERKGVNPQNLNYNGYRAYPINEKELHALHEALQSLAGLAGTIDTQFNCEASNGLNSFFKVILRNKAVFLKSESRRIADILEKLLEHLRTQKKYHQNKGRK